MKIEQRKVSELIPYANNSRQHSDAQVAQIAASIKEFGWTNPILVDASNGIIAGHGRLMAARKLGMTEVPVIQLSHLSDNQRKALIIADNKLALNAGWDEELLKIELNELLDADFDLELTGFDKDELDELLRPAETTEGLTDEDAVPGVPEEPKTKPGDIYQLGRHRLMCGDSTSIDAVEKLIDGAQIDLVFTDPPYGINEKGDRSNRGGIAQGNKLQDFKDDTIQYAIDAYNIVEGVLKVPRQVWWGANYYCHSLPLSNNWFVWDKRVEEKQKDTQSDCELAWVKSKWSSVRIFRHLWKGLIKESERGQKRVHPTQKPVALAEWGFDYFKEFNTVLDLFGGSGSTLIAAEKKQKQCFMMEFEPYYCDVIVKRWEDFTGKKAELVA
ncbi:site-specific DNA-methyltransferase [bacterium]|nr:site-specific DNA-methyltransferase [bacterium]